MTKEYIEREAAMPDGFCVGVSCQECPFCVHPIKGGCKVARFIDAIPTADVVAVVRCRECKHSIMHKFPYNYEKVLACNDPHGVTIRAVKPMHFCSYGERKDGGLTP